MVSTIQYPEAVRSLIDEAELNGLDAGQPNAKAKGALERLTRDDLVGSAGVRDPAMADACLSGLWLLHNYLDQSHTISQSIEGSTGAFWHGIMHRREGDFGNAKYWFCRVGAHPTFSNLGNAAKEAASSMNEPAAAFLARQTLWDANRFVDLCEQAGSRDSQLNFLCRKLQRLEWDILFAYCLQKASLAK